MRVSIIISFRQSDDDRRSNLKGVLNYLLRFHEAEVIIVEQDSVSRLDWLSEVVGRERIKHVLLHNGDIFNKGWGYNVGVRLSQGDFLLFSDADLYIRPDNYMGLLSYFPKFDVVNPYNEIYYLNKIYSDRFVNGGYSMSIVHRPRATMYRVKARVISGGIFMIRREVFCALKGFDERCSGFGYEDDIFDAKMRKTGAKIKDITDYCIHVFHKSVREGMDKSDEYFSHFHRNRDLFREYERMTTEEINTLIENTQTWGEGSYESIAH